MSKYFYTILLSISLLFTFLTIFNVHAHSGKARFHVIVDVDGAADDLRTLSMLLGNREIEVLSINSSNGALTPAETANRISALLKEFFNEGVPVGVGREVKSVEPEWRDMSRKINWSDSISTQNILQVAPALIKETLDNEEEKVTYLALGSLTNLSDLLSLFPNSKNKIDRIVWYNDYDNIEESANYLADKISADSILKSGIKIDIISMNPQHKYFITKRFIDSISNINTPYSKKIVQTHNSYPIKELINKGHLMGWDDLVAVYLFNPKLFNKKECDGLITCYESRGDVADSIEISVINILKGKTDSESRVLYGFPTDKNLYQNDVTDILYPALHKYGPSEWRAAVLTNELHGHLGIYATIGVKMGIRAREFFNIGVDDINVTSFAGSNPPISCMNDGLQVSTGGTVGHGLFNISNHPIIRPEAIFKFKNKTVRMRLKKEYSDIISEDVKKGVQMFGDSEDYWNYVRKLALKYWLQFDRHNIFEIYNN